MKGRKLDAMAQTLNDEFKAHLAEAVRVKFGLEVETTFNIFSLAMVTRRADGADFTPEGLAFVGAYSDGYGKALELVRAHAAGVAG